MPRPLEGITVLDVTVALAGPFATLLLGGLGARVIKVENPASPDTARNNAPYLGRDGAKLIREHPDDISISALNRLRNKLGVTLNLKHPRAREVFADLVKQSDILVENFSRGTLDRLGAGYEVARAINPRIVYCSITGYGSSGETGSRKAMDAIVQALSGVMMTSGGPDDPPVRVGLPIADMTAPLFAVVGALAALNQAQRTGLGQHVDVSMLGVMTSIVAGEHFDVLERLGVPIRTGQTVARLAPFGIYRASDGYIAICASTERFARALFSAMGRPELAEDERFRSRDHRVKNVFQLDALIEAWSSELSMADAIARLDAAGVPSSEVRGPNAAVRDPLMVERGDTERLSHPTYGQVDDVFGMGLPIKFSGATAGYDRPPPRLGEHNDTVYGDLLGYSAEQIAQLRDEGVI